MTDAEKRCSAVLVALAFLAFFDCGGGSSGAGSSDSGGDAGFDVAEASQEAPDSSPETSDDSAQLEASSDAPLDSAGDSLVEAAADAQADAPGDAVDSSPPCVPTCAHHPCGTDDGCGGKCAPIADGGSSACIETAYFTVNYNDTAFGGVCASSGDRDSTSCSAGAVRYCTAKGFGTGFPEQTITGAIGILCVALPAVDTGNVAFSMVASYNSTCTTSNYYSLDCESAADDYCQANGGYAGGFGPNEIGSGAVSVSCIPSSVGVRMSNVPSSVFSACGVTKSQDCDAAAANYCTGLGLGYAGGVGPLQVDGSATAVICILAN